GPRSAEVESVQAPTPRRRLRRARALGRAVMLMQMHAQMQIVPRVRRCRRCPLPLWERAPQWLSEDEGVRGPLRKNLCEAAPSPDGVRWHTEPPSPARGEGANARVPLAVRQLTQMQMQLMPRVRRCRTCPLPSRERATQWLSEDEGVRGPLRKNLCEAAPSPGRVRWNTEPPSPARGEGACARASLADRQL